MFFPKKIKSIRPRDRVLEIGPGATPHSRSNAFLEIVFDTDQLKILQRGGLLKEPDFARRPVYYYDGGKFPFDDKQFDYVICSHVIEHVHDVTGFANEIFRVGGGRGYLEYPLITYEYLYDFGVHLNFVKFDFELNVLRYLPKQETSFSEFAAVTAIFNRMLVSGWGDLWASNKELFFEGVEFNRPFAVEKTGELEKLLPPQSLIVPKRTVRKFLGWIMNKLGL